MDSRFRGNHVLISRAAGRAAVVLRHKLGRLSRDSSDVGNGVCCYISPSNRIWFAHCSSDLKPEGHSVPSVCGNRPFSVDARRCDTYGMRVSVTVLHPRNPPFHRMNNVGAEVARGKDVTERAHPECTLDAVHAVKLGGQLAQFLGANALEEFVPFDAQAAFFCAVCFGIRWPSSSMRGSFFVLVSTSGQIPRPPRALRLSPMHRSLPRPRLRGFHSGLAKTPHRRRHGSEISRRIIADRGN